MSVGLPLGLDKPGTRCAFNVHACSYAVIGHGGFDLHHRWPKSMGGPEHPDDLLVLCPNHHRRQHALVRYLVEHRATGNPPAQSVLRGYKPVEVDTAMYALQSWIAAGSPPIADWSAPAARS